MERADHKKINMGLNVWQDGPEGKIKTTDVVVAKNYLDENELNQLERIVTMYLDYAEYMTSTIADCNCYKKIILMMIL